MNTLMVFILILKGGPMPKNATQALKTHHQVKTQKKQQPLHPYPTLKNIMDPDALATFIAAQKEVTALALAIIAQTPVKDYNKNSEPRPIIA